ncbi:MAG: hypothetical protein QNJ36_12815 [Calothrix sp. MO_167.B42]|nr:hypothetical protein [Calothrix sp. MO_167.B42]
MENQLGFILKVLILSIGLSITIKYICPFLSVRATSSNALIIVLLPITLLTVSLIWRWRGQENLTKNT